MPSLSPTFSTLSTSPRRCHPPSDVTVILELASWRKNAGSSLRSRPGDLIEKGLCLFLPTSGSSWMTLLFGDTFPAHLTG